jgi:hypothetical protein
MGNSIIVYEKHQRRNENTVSKSAEADILVFRYISEDSEAFAPLL